MSKNTTLGVVIRVTDRGSQQMKEVTKNTNRMVGSFRKSISSMLSLKRAIAGVAVASGVRFIVDTQREVEALDNKLRASVLTLDQFKDAQRFVSEESTRLGIRIQDATKGFASFAAAGLRSNMTYEETKQVFSDMSEAVVSLQLPTENAQNVFRALEQIASKGRLTMEELRQQLADHLPGAINIAQQSVGVFGEEFFKMVAKGEVAAEDFLPSFAKAIKDNLGGSAQAAAEGMFGTMNRLSNIWFEFSKKVSAAFSPIITVALRNFTSRMDDLTNESKFLDLALQGATIALTGLLQTGIVFSNVFTTVHMLFNEVKLAAHTVAKGFGYVHMGMLKMVELKSKLTGDKMGMASAAEGLEVVRDTLREIDEASVNILLSQGELADKIAANELKMIEYSDAQKRAMVEVARMRAKAALGPGDLDTGSPGQKKRGTAGSGGEDPATKKKEIEKMLQTRMDLHREHMLRKANLYKEESKRLKEIEAIEYEERLQKFFEHAEQAKLGLEDFLAQEKSLRKEYVNNIQTIEDEAAERRLKAFREQTDHYVRVGRTWGEALSAGIGKGKKGFETTLKEVLLTGLDFLQAFALEAIAAAAARGAMTGGPIGSAASAAIVSGIVTAAIGAARAGVNAIEFATGTSRTPSGNMIVGERGPELVQMPIGSQIVSNRDLRSASGGNNVTIHNITVSGEQAEKYSSPQGRRALEKLARDMEDVFRMRLIDNNRTPFQVA